MDAYQETFETWNKIAKVYEDKYMNLPLYNDTYDSFLNLLPKRAKILDVGCGPGNVSKYLLDHQPDLEILGVDISQNMVDLASKNLPKAQFKVLDFRNLDQLQTSFQGIICGFGLPYLSSGDVKVFFNQCDQLLYPDGILYISFVPGHETDSHFITGMNGLRVYFNYHDPKKIKTLLGNHQFKLLEQMEVPFQRKDNSTETHLIFLASKIS